MPDSIAAWMISGGLRNDADDRRIRHLVAIGESRDPARAGRPGIIDRVQARFATPKATPATDCCTA